MRRGGGNSFLGGLQFGERAYRDADNSRRQDKLDAEREWRFQQEQDAAARGAANRADLSYIAQDGMTGITPNMTVPGPGGMGPVASPQDIDIRAQRGEALDPSSIRGLPPAPVIPPTNMPVTMDDGNGGVYSAPAPAPARMSGLVTPGAAAPVAMPNGDTGVIPAAPGPTAPPAGAAPAATGLTDADKEARIGAISLRSGDVAGYRTARESAKALKKQQDYTEFGKKLAGMSNEDLALEAKKWVTDNPGAAGTLGYDPKTRMFTIIHDTGAAQTIDPIQARSYALAAFQMGNGDVEKGMTELLNADAVTKAQARQKTADANALTEQVGKQGNAVFTSNDTAAYHTGELGIQQQRLALERDKMNRDKAKDAKGSLVTLQDKETGEPVMGFAGTGKDGKSTFTKIDLPEGLRLPKDMSGTINRKDALTIAQKMVSDGVIDPATKDKDGKNGTPYSLGSATDAVMAAGGFGHAAAATGTPVDLSDLATRLKNQKAGLPPQVAGAGRGLMMPPPPAPPQMINRGGNMQVNPDWVDWNRQFGQMPTPTRAIRPPNPATQQLLNSLQR